MNGFEKRTEAKKKTIKKEANRLFEKYGFNRVTLDEIATSASVSRVTIYKYFGDKETLLKEILQDTACETTDRIESIIESDRPFMMKFKEITDLKMDITSITDNNFIGETIENNGEIGGVVTPELIKRISVMIEKFINQGKAEKLIKADLPTRTVLNYFKIMRAGLKQLQEAEDPLLQDHEQLLLLMGLFMEGLK